MRAVVWPEASSSTFASIRTAELIRFFPLPIADRFARSTPPPSPLQRRSRRLFLLLSMRHSSLSSERALQIFPSFPAMSLTSYPGSPLRIDSSPRASGVLDTVLVCRAHEIKLPKELEDPKTLRLLEGAICHEWYVRPLSADYSRALTL